MKPKSFAFLTAVIAAAYSACCFFLFKEPFWGFTALVLGFLATVYPLYFERQRKDTIADAQVAQYLRLSLPDKEDNQVFKRKLHNIYKTLEQMEQGIVELSYEEFAPIMHARMAQRISAGNPVTFVSTHTVDSEASVEIWGRTPSAYPWLKGYVTQQQNILRNGGIVSRIFLFERDWLKSHLVEAMRIVNNHDRYFQEHKESLRIYAYLMRPIGEELRDAFSVIDDVEVFYWKRSKIPEIRAFDGGRYIRDPKQVKEYVEKWARLAQDSYPPETLFKMVENGTI